MKKQILGAVTLSAALAVGMCMPAFAAQDGTTGKVTSGTGEFYTGGETTATVSTTMEQIDCTIPLELPFVANMLGGNLDTSSAGTYGITNNSDKADLYVTNMVVSDFSTDWNFVATTGAANASSGYSSTGVNYGDVFVQVNYNTNGSTSTSANTPIVKASGSDSLTIPVTTETFKINQKQTGGAEGHNTTAITFAGSNGKLKTSIASDAPQDLFKVTYTVSYNPYNTTEYTPAS
ncbi:hypothetical protein [Adlercreutzia sp. ZJ304]|uniref:hypothetical protein n=1 Tax=Adlercreutzia sp. ZJ304 TaxID=2709791 RepID=UPI0013EC03BF|nr:hypothetical protein [Adlercreutzia sp. ZJ304]